jgi:hypothetical protein
MVEKNIKHITGPRIQEKSFLFKKKAFFLDFLTLADATNRSSLNVGTELPLYAV